MCEDGKKVCGEVFEFDWMINVYVDWGFFSLGFRQPAIWLKVQSITYSIPVKN